MELLQTDSLRDARTKKITRRFPVIVGIVLFAFLIRLAFLAAVPPPAIDSRGDDSTLYDVAGKQLSEYFKNSGRLVKEFFSGNLFRGRGILTQYGLEIPWGAFKRGITYPFFVGLIFLFFGPNPFPVFVAQAALLSLACGLIYGIAKELGEAKVGLVGAAIAAVYPPFVTIAAKLLQESVSIFLFVFFYFLALRSEKSSSPRLFSFTGIVLFLYSLSRSTLAFFPFFLAVMMGTASRFFGKAGLPVKNLSVLAMSFFLPYLIWTGIVSWQMQHPAIVVEPAGRELFSAVHPDYDGWTSDIFLGREPDSKVARVLREEGISLSSANGNWAWPDQSQLLGASLKIILKHPIVSLRMAVDKFRRFWGEPHNWPWKYFLVPQEPLRWFHRFLAITAVMGWVLWCFNRPFHLWFLLVPALYGTIFHSFFHIETRYALGFFALFPLFSGFFIYSLWFHRKSLFTPPRKFSGLLTVAAATGLVFRMSAVMEHGLAVGLQSLGLAALFVAAGICLWNIIPKVRLLAGLSVTALLVMIPFETYALTNEDWRLWGTPIRSPLQQVRQEIFLPPGSLRESVSQNLRLDLVLPSHPTPGEVLVNGQTVARLESLKFSSPRFPLASYEAFLRDERRRPFEMRQWFSVSIPSQLLKEGKFNTVEILSAEGVLLFGDDPTNSPQPVFHGPLFQHSDDDVSVLKYIFDGDFRISGTTPLHHGGVRSSFYDGKDWRMDDLSPARGVQKGEYRIRIEIVCGGEVLVY